jgi:hypothetical protein
MWRSPGGRLKTTLLIGLLGICVLRLAAPASAQLTAGASIVLSATVPSSVTLTDNLLPVSMVVANGTQTVANIPVGIRWNLDPREKTGYRLVATLTNSTLALSALEASIDGAPFRRLAQSTNHIVLMNVWVNAGNKQGERQIAVHIRVNEAALVDVPDGVYQAWLRLEAQTLP